MSTANLGEFKMPTVTDVPKLTTVLMEDATGPTPYQGKAIAEIPNVPTAAAIAKRSKTPSACGCMTCRLRPRKFTDLQNA